MKPTRYDQVRAKEPTLASAYKDKFPELAMHPSGLVLTATFPTPLESKGEQRIDLSFLAAVPQLQEALSQGFVLIGRRSEVKTRSVLGTSLRTGFIEFLKHTSRESISVEGITTELLQEFLAWCGREENGKPVWEKGTQKGKYRALTGIIRTMRRHELWKGSFPPGLRIPVMADPKKFYEPTRVLDNEFWEKVYIAAVEEVVSRRMAFAEFERMSADAVREYALFKVSAKAETPAVFSESMTLALGALLTAYGTGAICTREELSLRNKALYDYLFGGAANASVVKQFAESLYPSRTRQLVPYLLLYAMYFSYNPSTAINAKVSNFRTVSVLGSERFWANPYKTKSRRSQIRTCGISEDAANPHAMYGQLIRWTARLRMSAKPWCKDRLFLFSDKLLDGQEAGVRAVTGFSVGAAIREFCDDHGLDQFVFKQLRPSSLEQVRVLFDGDIRASQVAANHRSRDTTDRSYTSDAERQRQWERLGAGIALRSRWVESDGLIDARSSQDDAHDVGAATPGWGCLYPFHSPMVGQVAGKLCTEYGGCPVCPHAQLDIDSPASAKRVTQLRELILNAQTKIPAQRWLSTWAPRLKRIDQFWLPQFRPETLAKSEILILTPLPPID
ncbi:hypothetical protein [Solimonas sp. SE-A11]|uniref:hypothetical protein n=1 Tax=Solimonas sp. SE-A11 TaxID=3054954 RepID=UPI00259CD76C|nr:hypothetical protein [Solimonas sp. SE-A11]MDM4771598.1 hypothetical protein [Solimonas sp. SE-A11]